MIESLFCTSETNTTLKINYMSVTTTNKKWKHRDDRLPGLAQGPEQWVDFPGMTPVMLGKHTPPVTTCG